MKAPALRAASIVDRIAARTVTKTSPPRKDPASRGDEAGDEGDARPAVREERQEEHPGRDDAGVEEPEEEGRDGRSPAGGRFAPGRLHPLPGDRRDRPGQDEGEGDEDVALGPGKEIEVETLSGPGRRGAHGAPRGPRRQRRDHPGDAGDEKGELEDVRPGHGLETARGGVDA